MEAVLVAQEGRETEGILMYQKCIRLFEEGKSSDLMRVFVKLGQAYTTIGTWDDAIAYLEKGLALTESIEDESLGNQLNDVAQQSLGNTYLEKFYTDESLVGIPERSDELIRKALFWSEAAFKCQELVKLALYLDLSQEHYFLGDTEKSHLMLKKYLDATVQLGQSRCQSCSQACAKDAIMEKCSVCKVARYCSQAHNIQAWKKGRLCNKVMCPLLKRWRKITEGKNATTEICDELFSTFFERVLASKPK